MTIGRVLTQVVHELIGNFNRHGISLVVVVTEGHVVAFAFKANGQTTFVTNHLNLAITDGHQRVRHDGKAGNTRCEDAFNVTIVQSQFIGFVAVLIVHVVDDLQGVGVNASQPAHHLFVLFHHFVVVEVLGSNGFKLRSHLFTRAFIATAVDCVKQCLGKVGASAEELHLLTDLHRGDAACDTVVVAEVHTHQVIVFVLDGRGVNRNLGAELLPIFRQLIGPKNCQVGFRSRT